MRKYRLWQVKGNPCVCLTLRFGYSSCNSHYLLQENFILHTLLKAAKGSTEMSHQFLLINAGIVVPIIIVAKNYQTTDFIFVVEVKTILIAITRTPILSLFTC